MVALTLTVDEANHLIRRTKDARIFRTYGIDITTEPASPLPCNGELLDAVFVIVHADTDKQVGIGVGFLSAHFFGLDRG